VREDGKSAFRLHASFLPCALDALHKEPEKSLWYLFVKKLLTGPFSILNHIIKLIDPTLYVSDLETYDTSGTRQRHIPLIRAAQQIQPYGPAARTCALQAMIGVARTKEDVAYLINVALEPLPKTVLSCRRLQRSTKLLTTFEQLPRVDCTISRVSGKMSFAHVDWDRSVAF
jgi:hypothetical protein